MKKIALLFAALALLALLCSCSEPVYDSFESEHYDIGESSWKDGLGAGLSGLFK